MMHPAWCIDSFQQWLYKYILNTMNQQDKDTGNEGKFTKMQKRN